jgi:hypothetical protein
LDGVFTRFSNRPKNNRPKSLLGRPYCFAMNFEKEKIVGHFIAAVELSIVAHRRQEVISEAL